MVSLSVDEFRGLTRWALVTLAVRAARRVHPVATVRQGISSQSIEVIDRAIDLIERSASTGTVSRLLGHAVMDIRELAWNVGRGYANAQREMPVRDGGTLTALARQASAFEVVYNAAVCALDEIYLSVDECEARWPDAYCYWACAITGDLFYIHSRIRDEIHTLLETSLKENWTDTTPVDPTPLGILGPL